MTYYSSIKHSGTMIFLIIILCAFNSTAQNASTYINLDIGVDVGEVYEFSINNFSEQNYDILEFMIPIDYSDYLNEPNIKEEIFSITITEIKNVSSERVCHVLDTGCTFFLPEIYVNLHSGSMNISGMIDLSNESLGDLITTTNWELVKDYVLEIPSTNQFYSNFHVDNTFTNENGKVTITYDVSFSFNQTSDFQFPWEKASGNGIIMYDSETGVLLSSKVNRQLEYLNGTQENMSQDITNLNTITENDRLLQLPFLAFNQIAVFILVISSFYFIHRKVKLTQLASSSKFQ